MKISSPPHRRALVVLIPVMLSLATAARAQEATVAPPPAAPTAPPPVAPAVPQASTPPAAQPSGPTPLTGGVSARNGIGDPNSTTPIAPEAITQAEEDRSARAPAARAASRAPGRTRAPRAAPAAPAAAQTSAPAAPAVAPAPAAPAETPLTDAAIGTAAPAEPEAATPAAVASEPAAPEGATATPVATDSTPVWPWIVAGLIVLGALLAFFLRRRRRVDDDDEVYEEPVYVEPAHVESAHAEPAYVEPAHVEPVAAVPVARAAHDSATIPSVPLVQHTQTQGGAGRLAPQFLRSAPVAATLAAVSPAAASSAVHQAEAVAVEAELAEPEAEDVAALTAGSTVHSDRAWLEFAMRPVRAGGNADDALVEIELTVGNSGAVAAHDVRISTFMFADGSASAAEMERLLAAHADASEVTPVTIEPGEGTRVDAALSLSRAHLGEAMHSFNPVIVADARYRLADGSEGRTSASFTIGGTVDHDGDLRGIALHDGEMTEDIEARLHGVPVHA